MKNIKLGLSALLSMLAGLWLLADNLLPAPLTYFSFRGVFVQFTGILAMGTMSAAMILAMRPKWLEPRLNGLDKMYRLHKWLGISSLIFAVTHWWWAQGTKWMVAWGWLVRPQRRQRGPEDFGLIEAWLRSQRGLAEFLGEWVFYGVALLILLALIKRFPYHLFRKTHKWLAVGYLVFVYHTTVLSKFGYWTQPVGWLLALLMIGGALAAVRVLQHRVGAERQTRGVIESLEYYPNLRVLETAIRLDQGWQGHRAGQFAFVTSDRAEGAHPYTIASAWDARERRIVFITKALGDHTGRLHERLRVGDTVTVEGPYGCFDFQDSQPHQIWVGGGIGITPFIARMKDLARTAEPREITLFHTTSEVDQRALDKLRSDAKAANIRLHILVDSQDGFLDAERICAAVPQWPSASIWFCGPPKFGAMLRRAFVARGLAPAHFHQELFEMR